VCVAPVGGDPFGVLPNVGEPDRTSVPCVRRERHLAAGELPDHYRGKLEQCGNVLA